MQETKLRLILVAAVIVTACAIHGGGRGDERASTPPGPSVNHPVHAEAGLECADCHDPDSKGEPGPPAASFCFECHEDLAAESATVRAYFDKARRDGGYVWPHGRAGQDDVIFSHASHTGAYEVACDRCHGTPTQYQFAKRPPLTMKATCINCHQERGQEQVACEVCHTDRRRDKRPPDHDGAFVRAHGDEAGEGWRDPHNKQPLTWRDAAGGRCAICHEVPESCDTCHEVTRPESHGDAGFRITHGNADASMVVFEDSTCSMCHEQDSCVRCHQTEKPRSHTASWERRFHGIHASVDRERCATCHKQDFCVRCHETARPISHRGSFGKGSQSHCIACHEPLSASSCYTCHKNTLGHRSATPLPPGPPHAGARDCRTCHRALRHFDDGLSCRRCHR